MSVSELFRRALHTYLERFWLVVGFAVLLFGPAAVLSTLIEHWIEDAGEGRSGALNVALTLAELVSINAIVLGTVLYAAILDAIVGEHQHGHGSPTLGGLLRRLPYRRLIVADIVLTLAVQIGLLLLVIPGVVLFTLFCIVGPVITIEQLGVIDAFRRSARLVRPHFWLVAVAVTVPVAVEQIVEQAVEELVIEGWPLLSSFLSSAALGATIGAFVGLVEVTLAYQLILRDGGSPADAHGEWAGPIGARAHR